VTSAVPAALCGLSAEIDQFSRSMNFLSDGLADGSRIRCFNIVDDCTRECVAIEVEGQVHNSWATNETCDGRSSGID
jgi:hypothetical protein